MFVPLLLPASAVFEGADLNRTCECVCGKSQCLQGRLVVWSHRVGSDSWGWFLVCTPVCYLKNVTQGGMQ